jgi:cobaltochelatase CobT
VADSNDITRQLEAFKDGTAAAFRAISGHEKAQVRFATAYLATSSPGILEPAYNDAADMLTVPLAEELDAEELERLRGRVDAMALRLKFHDEKLHNTLRPDGVPGELLDMMERVRVEALGAAAMKGVAENLEAMHQQYFETRGYDKREHVKDMPHAEVIARLIFEKISGVKTPDFAKVMQDSWGKLLQKKMGGVLDELKESAENQEAYARLVRHMGKILGMEGALDEASVSEDTPKAVNTQKKNETTENTPAEEVPTEAPLPENMGDENVSSDKNKEKKDAGPDKPDKKGAEDPRGAPPPPKRNTPAIPVAFAYRAYTTKFDKVARARELAAPDELQYLRHQLDQRLSNIKDVTSRLASRLQRKLMSRRMRSWKFHMEEGIIDAAKLTHIITDPSYGYYYKYEKDTDDPNTVISLLIDNSGSMRGRPITVAALSADILARTLERCGVKVEILGFSTIDWKGGQSRRAWEAAGRPPQPGRLNDLLHIVYKTADEPWRLVRRNLGLMLKDGILKENIDGEALLWAHDRLMARREERKILMVISDGAPVDDATLAANTGDYLDHHLRQVIGLIEDTSPVELVAIGIGHDVGAYYSQAVTIREVEQLGDAMIAQLGRLFEGAVSTRPRKKRAS